MSGPGPVAFVGDAHLLASDETTRAFVAFLDRAPQRFSRLVLVGDIFDLWLARAHLHETHHRAVLGALSAARARGLRCDYVVGNRDFGVEGLSPSPFERVASVLLPAPPSDAEPPDAEPPDAEPPDAEPPDAEPPAWLAEHGDLVNDRDRQYRLWRAFARSRAVLGGFLSLPARIGVPLSQSLERRMRTTNLSYKRAFPRKQAEAHAERLFAETGASFLVLGHFHEELRFQVPGGTLLVLPDWKRSRRHAEWTPAEGSAGLMEFAES